MRALRISPWLVFFSVLLVAIALLGLLWWLGGGELPWLSWVLILGMALLFAWLARLWRERYQQQVLLMDRFSETQRRLDLALKLNSLLANASDEKSLVEGSLAILAELIGAKGSSYVPLDELGQPLAVFTQGEIGRYEEAQALLESFREGLVREDVRQRCQNCLEYQSLAGSTCPLLAGPLTRGLQVYCLPLQREQQTLGVFNFYLPVSTLPSNDLRPFLGGLLNEIALAVQIMRQRNQEWKTLRELQMSQVSQVDLTAHLGSLLEGLQSMLGVEFAYLFVEPMGEWQSPVRVYRGRNPWQDFQPLEEIYQEVRNTGQTLTLEKSGVDSREEVLFVMATPLCLENHQAVGMLVATSYRRGSKSRQVALLQSMAAQASRLVESQRLLLSLEYQSVIQERSRLAREIHDGLAQTLAYLKLQTAQMKNLLAQGDLTRLKQVLDQNYQVLSESYLDTRQSIDYLRLAPQVGLQRWMSQLSAEFEASSGLAVECVVEEMSYEPPLEVQVQLVRIIQEALSNIRKHARAQKVWLVLREWEGDLTLEIGDDGQGFAPEDVPELSRYGLRGMRERAEWLGADFQVVSQPGQGTKIRLRLPRAHLEALL